MSEVVSITAVARELAKARIAHAESILALGIEMQENAEDLQVAARIELEAGRAELRALDAAEAKSAS